MVVHTCLQLCQPPCPVLLIEHLQASRGEQLQASTVQMPGVPGRAVNLT